MRLYKILPLIMLILVGCSQGDADELPTLAPTLGGETRPTENATEPPTLNSQTTNPTAEIPANPTQPVNIGPPTLPPVWTATPITEPEIPTNTPIPPTPIPQATFLPSCRNFRPNDELNERIYTPGTVPTIAWNPIPEAVNYRVTLYDEFQIEIFSDFVSETIYRFPVEFFEEAKPYSWSVIPLNRQIQQFCPATGAELFPDRPATG